MAEEEINPYQAPLSQASTCSVAFGPNEETIRFVRRFRHGIHALGLMWFVIGVIKGAMSIWFVEVLVAHDLWIRQGQIIAIAVIIMWFLLSALTLAKQAWAVAAGLWLWWLTAAGALAAALVGGGDCWALLVWAAIILPPALVQGTRVLRWAHELQAAGVPLTLRPSQVVEFFRNRGVVL